MAGPGWRRSVSCLNVRAGARKPGPRRWDTDTTRPGSQQKTPAGQTIGRAQAATRLLRREPAARQFAAGAEARYVRAVDPAETIREDLRPYLCLPSTRSREGWRATHRAGRVP